MQDSEIIMNGSLDVVTNNTIPIYTLRNPHPVKKKSDCNLTQDYKRRLRYAMRAELVAVVKRYESKAKDL